jgi:ribosomal protein L7/L12
MELLLGLAVFAVAVLILRGISKRGESAPAPPGPVTEDTVRHYLAQGRKIQAIKAYREIHPTGLKEAKEAVERIEKNLPPTPY